MDKMETTGLVGTMMPQWPKLPKMSRTLLAFITIAIVFLGALASCSAYMARDDERKQRMIEVCGELGLEAVDLEFGHTPKCLNLETGIMTVPRKLFEMRGGHL